MALKVCAIANLLLHNHSNCMVVPRPFQRQFRNNYLYLITTSFYFFSIHQDGYIKKQINTCVFMFMKCILI